jgi:hypothetical protein
VTATVRRICVTDEEECIEYLLSCCPAFGPHWKEHRAPWGDEPTPGGLMLDLAAFGRYAADAIARNSATELAAIGEAAERLVDWPSDHIQTAAVFGFLEGLTNICLGEPERYPFQRLARYLGPSAVAACRDLDDQWGTQTPGV